ncbi:MAG: hypothetical protein E7393_05805 [Ruminococcaceae bacterium]|nr:hypothetical protein [Oscillospiraceae bacterium]
MKHKINILIPIFALLVLMYAVRSFAGTRVQTETLRRSSMEDLFSTKGVIIKYESVIEPGGTGGLEPISQEGARVATGQEIAVVYTGSVDTELQNQLEQVNKKIVQVEKNQANLFTFTGDVSRLEQKITEQIAALVKSSLAGDMASVSEIQFVIESLCEKKAQIAEGNTPQNLLTELQAQKNKLEAQIGYAGRKLAAPRAGLFSTAVDGLEDILTPYNMTELTPNAVDKLLEQSVRKEAGEISACKIIDNFRYFVAVNLPADRLDTLKIDEAVHLRFYDLSGDLIPATVHYISPEENEYKTVIVEANQHLETLLKKRFVNLEFVRNRYAGYRISVKSLRSKDDVPGVYVRREDMLRFIPVTILYNTQDAAIVESADESIPLRLYDEVVVSASSYEEGKLLQ